MGLAVRDRAGLVAREALAVRDQVDRAARGQADRVGRVDLVGLGVLEAMNRVALGVMEDMALADPAALADLASLGVRDQVGLEDMDLADLGLGVRNQGALADRVGPGLRALDPEGREARDLGRALLGRMPTALDLAWQGRMPALDL
ncbi:MAG: hypothetical protein WAK42_22345, partial [Mycobacterium sp.]